MRPGGLFVTIDGPNGVGKSCFAAELTRALRTRGFDVLSTAEPTDSILGKMVREMEGTLHGKAFACLIAADRYLHVANEIAPALMSGKVVVSSRFLASSLVYQRMEDVPLDFIWSIISSLPTPDINIILSSAPEILRNRLKERSTLKWFEEKALRDQEMKYFLEAGDLLNDRGFKVVILENGKSPIEENVNTILNLILTQYSVFEPDEP
jgi:dTMP kinase